MAKFRVTLTDEERCGLRKMVSSGKGAARTLLQGCIVLQADASLDGMRYTDEAIAEALRVRLSSIHRVRQQCVEESFEAARKPRRPRKRPDKVTITGEVEQRLLAWACREPPRPARRWPRRQTLLPRLSGRLTGQRRLRRYRRAPRWGRWPPARPSPSSVVHRPPAPWGRAWGAGPWCRRACSDPALVPGDTRPAPGGPTRAPWPHRAHATASRPPRGRRRGDAPSWTACPRRGRRERPDALAPDACGATGAAG